MINCPGIKELWSKKFKIGCRACLESHAILKGCSENLTLCGRTDGNIFENYMKNAVNVTQEHKIIISNLCYHLVNISHEQYTFGLMMFTNFTKPKVNTCMNINEFDQIHGKQKNNCRLNVVYLFTIWESNVQFLPQNKEVTLV